MSKANLRYILYFFLGCTLATLGLSAISANRETVGRPSERDGPAHRQKDSVRLLKPLAAGETGFDFVPPFYFVIFAELPAEEDDAAVAHRRKIDQAPGVIF